MAKPRLCVVRVDGYEARFLLASAGRNIKIDAEEFKVESRTDGAVVLRYWDDEGEAAILLRGPSLPRRAPSVVGGVYFFPVVIDGEDAAVVAARRKIKFPRFFWDDDEMRRAINDNPDAIGDISRSGDEWSASFGSGFGEDEQDDAEEAISGPSFIKTQRLFVEVLDAMTKTKS